MDYTIRVDTFRGPMELLLHLVRREEVDVQEIPIAEIVDEFCRYMTTRGLDLDLASDFAVLTASLMLFKSQSLLPREEIDLEEDVDPYSDLVRQLLQYKRYRDLAAKLEELGDARSKRYGRQRSSEPPLTGEIERPLAEVDLWDLVGAFARILMETGAERARTIVYDERPISYYIDRVWSSIEGRTEGVTLALLLGDEPARDDVVGTFIAILELARQKRIRLWQAAPFGEITILPRERTEPTPVPEAPGAAREPS